MVNQDMRKVDLFLEKESDSWQVPHFTETVWGEKRNHFVVIVPTINEGDYVINLLCSMQEIGLSALADLIVVDGGSTDHSIPEICKQRLTTRGVLVKTGRGRLSAQLRCAYAWALKEGYRGIITIDGNNKDDPTAIPRFIEALEQGVDFVQASRYVPGGRSINTPRIRDLAIRFIHAPVLAKASGFPWSDTTQGFRGYSRRLLLSSKIAPFRHVFNSYELLSYLSYRAPLMGFRCQEIPCTRRYPSGCVPTKIGFLRGNLELLKTLGLTISGAFNP